MSSQKGIGTKYDKNPNKTNHETGIDSDDDSDDEVFGPLPNRVQMAHELFSGIFQYTHT